LVFQVVPEGENGDRGFGITLQEINENTRKGFYVSGFHADAAFFSPLAFLAPIMKSKIPTTMSTMKTALMPI